MKSAAAVLDMDKESEAAGSKLLRSVLDALRGLRFGAVTIVVQDGVIVQVERTERLRLREGGRSP